MAYSDCTLTYNGETKALADWFPDGGAGIEAAVFDHTLGGMDTLSISYASPINTAPIFPKFAEVVLKDRNGVTRFRGVAHPRRSGYTVMIELHGGDYWLKAHVKQEARFLVDGVFTFAEIPAFNQGADVVGDEIDEIIAQVVAQGAPITVAYTAIGGAPGNRVPEDQQRDLTAAQAIDRILAWTPWMARRWNYTTGTKMEFVSVLPAGHGYEVGGVALPANTAVRTIALGEIESNPPPDFNPRYDLLIPGVDIVFQGWEVEMVDTTVNPVGSAGVTGLAWVRSQQSANASPANGSFGRKQMFIPLRKPMWEASALVPGEEPPTDLAMQVGAPYFIQWNDAQWTVKGETCDFSVIPGELWTVTDGDPEYDGTGSICQSVSHDLKTGTTTVTCGAPQNLDLNSPWLANRLRKLQSDEESSGYNAGFQTTPHDGSDEGTTLHFVGWKREAVGGAKSFSVFSVKGTEVPLDLDELVSAHVFTADGTFSPKKLKTMAVLDDPHADFTKVKAAVDVEGTRYTGHVLGPMEVLP